MTEAMAEKKRDNLEIIFFPADQLEYFYAKSAFTVCGHVLDYFLHPWPGMRIWI